MHLHADIIVLSTDRPIQTKTDCDRIARVSADTSPHSVVIQMRTIVVNNRIRNGLDLQVVRSAYKIAPVNISKAGVGKAVIPNW